MLLSVYEQPGNHHFDRKNHLVFVLLNAEQQGLNRVPIEPYTCDCGATLTPTVLDTGDKSKTSWPNCKSWREGGRKKCPECDEYPSIDREQHIRARGYEPTPKDEIKNLTQNQRQEALDSQDGLCTCCDSEANYVVRVVPPRYGGTRDRSNLARLCDRHYKNFGQMFADILVPFEWHQIHDVSWREIAMRYRAEFSEAGKEKSALVLDSLLEKGQGENPYPYIDA